MLAVIPAGHRSPATSGSPLSDDNLLDAELCSADPEADPLGADAIAAGADESWWQAVSAQIARSEYEPKVTAAGLQAPNRAQNLRTTFGARGIEVAPRTSEEVAPTWRFRWQTSGIGREGSMQEVDAVSPEWAGDRVTYRHEGWSEWYVNTAAGLEQGFTLEQRPDGEGPLRIAGNVPAELKPEVREDGAIDFIESHGACAIRYGELHVWDADGIELHSELAVHGSELAIVIDDRNAEYPLMVDPLMTSPAWTAESNQANAGFGFSVATAGDVNGDGYSDVIVGASNYDNGQADEGRAFVYYGSASGLSLNPNWTAESNQASASFGFSVGTAGDSNGDGYSDVIVAAIGYDNGQVDEGRAFVYHGSASGLATTPAWTAESNVTNAFFGTTVATAGDVNGDGYADVIVGAYAYANGQTEEGRAYVFHGSALGLAVSAAWTAESNQAVAQFGFAVATAGDVNGDNYADVIVGAPGYDNGQSEEGRAFVYLGSAAGLAASAAWTAESDQAGAVFGVSVATAGDVNGDGYADVIVGAYGYDNGHSDEGRTYLFLGSAFGLAASAAWTAESDQVFANFGVSVGTAGDVNGDGYADVIVGAHRYDNGQTDEGRVYVYHGSALGLAASANWSVESDQEVANFGLSVGTAGDVNGDGYSDVLIGAPHYDNGQSDEGRAFVYHGAAAGLATTLAWTAESNQAESSFGGTVASAGDVNGDGYSDVIVGASHYDNGQTNEGRAFVYHGSPAGLSASANWTAESDHAAGFFGVSVASAGDVNGDGYSDVLVGSVWAENGVFVGRAFAYHGSATGLAASPAWFVQGEGDEESGFARTVATAGDVNGDGYSDAIIGAPASPFAEIEGRAYVYHGSPVGLASSPAWFAENDQEAWTNFGACVATAGDVNRDGFSDVIVGADWYGNGENNEGGAFVYHGSASGLNLTANWTVESNQVNGSFGRSVATAGDVNGDGYSDIIVGASGGDGNQGRAYVYHGSAGGLATSAAWSAESDQSFADLGFSVATAGDVNGDGYSDVIVSVDLYDNPEVNEGRPLVYHGSAIGLSATPQWSAEINQVGASFGQCVATAGDVNGDGYSDVILGAWKYDHGQTDEGGAWVYYGNGGDGLDIIPRQARTDDSALISLLGRSDSPSAFRLKTLGRTPAGRGNVRLQAEIKPLGVVFNGSGLVFGLETNTGAPSGGGSVVPLSELVGALSANTVYHWRLRIVSDSPFFPRSPWFSQVGNAPNEADFRMAGTTVAVADPSVGTTHLWLEPSAPNPFTNETRVAYTLPERGRVRLAVYDVVGREVAVLAEGMQEVGRHSQGWDGRSSHGARLSAGVYFARLEFAGRVEARKMVLTR